MEAQDLRQLKKEEIEVKLTQWREELFRNRFKAQTSEAKDTSVFLKLRRDIARGMTILNETKLGITRETKSVPTTEGKPVKATTAKKAAPKATKKVAPKKDKE